VSATEVGVPVTLGKVGIPVSSGVHFKAPLTSIETLPIRPFTLPEDIQVSARTNQGGNVVAKYGARWVVDPKEAGSVYLQVRTGDEEKISKDLVEKSLATAVGNAYSKYDNSTATTARVQAETEVTAEVNRILDPYGVKVTQVFLRQVDPDDKTKDSLNKLSASKNKTLIAEQEVKTAEQEALAAQARAKGAQEATNQIPKDLSPQQITLYCAQLWAQAQSDATEKGQTLWTTPCDSGSSATPLVQQK
jgi:regulator of protease activity HflC (stomatin/prohibitin superfamily)